MKKIFLIILSVICWMGIFSCNKEDASVIEPKMTLYDKPLSTIKQVIEGKWKWYVSYGGFVGISYFENTFVEFKGDLMTIDYENGRQVTTSIDWKKLPITAYNDPLKGNKTYVIWDKEEQKGTWYFSSICNDTLGGGSYDEPMSFGFVRVK